MPAIITHDLFGKAVYEEKASFIGETPEQRFAFLLGNQGPDPLFYARANPSISEFASFGSTMHAVNTDAMLVAFHDALDVLSPDEKPIGRAYLLGFGFHRSSVSVCQPICSLRCGC